LNRSYRCPENILKAAGQVLQKKYLLSGKTDPVKIHLQQCETDRSEADWIAAQIEKMIGGVASFSRDSGISDGQQSEHIGSFRDFAILCRTTRLFSTITKALEDHGIAYQVVGTEPFYRTEPFRSVIKSFKDAFLARNKEGQQKIENNIAFEVESMIKQKKSLAQILHRLLIDYQLSDEDQQRLENMARPFGADYLGFLSALNTRQGIDDYNDKVEAVSVMTMHAAKGLEFNCVFIPACEDNVLPFTFFGIKTSEEIKEEERLFYVSLTRTRKYLYISFARKRTIKYKVLKQEKSPFLDRLEKKLYELQKQTTKNDEKEKFDQLQMF
ncbi:MAG: ATP-dependent helicase, partial [Candidatus Margulisbacteria bacterium]|nr:ATP-dependent helicase [Candidatus Margulisiibacteriota bacterium]